jgi:hypothetical protein
MQMPRLQIWLPAHTWQAAPLLPHAEEPALVWHLPVESQQPLAQVEALQLELAPHDGESASRAPNAKPLASAEKEIVFKVSPLREQPAAARAQSSADRASASYLTPWRGATQHLCPPALNALV